MGEDKNRNTEGGKITLYFRGWGMNRELRESINENIRICLFFFCCCMKELYLKHFSVLHGDASSHWKL
jgi:hypothetical protein